LNPASNRRPRSGIQRLHTLISEVPPMVRSASRSVYGIVPLALLWSCSAPSSRPEVPGNVVGHCTYRNNFSGGDECHEFRGAFTVEKAKAECDKKSVEFFEATPCTVGATLGECLVDKPDVGFRRVFFLGDDVTTCNTMRTGCEVFAGGYYEPSESCGGVTGGGTGLPVWQQPRRICKAPKAGEAPGKGPDGQVCTWQVISGATEEGRNFSDYASCDAVRTQRPYYAAPQDERATTHADDPRLNDTDYVRELDWLKAQVNAAACVCCHRSDAPQGPSNWSVDAPGNFLNGWHDRGLAMGAGWIDTVGFGAYAPEDNNGFSRSTPDNPTHPALPTTDAARMAAIFVKELEHRSKSPADFVDAPPGAGPLDEQRFYRPADCTDADRVDADGTIHWRFGDARYVYVLEADATSPGVMPNLHIPAGTRWYVEVPDTSEAVKSGALKFGVVPEGLRQGFPSTGSPAALEKGRKYYLVVLADVALPSARCLFTAK